VPRPAAADARRAELVAVTAAEIARGGLTTLTMRDVARAGGWTTGIVTHYFADKRDLLLATFFANCDALRARIESALAARPGDPLATAIGAALPIDPDAVELWRVFVAYWGVAVGDDEFAAALVERQDRFVATLVEAMAAEQAAGRMDRGVDRRRVARRLLAAIDGIALQAVFDPASWPAAAQRRAIDDVLAPYRSPRTPGTHPGDVTAPPGRRRSRPPAPSNRARGGTSTERRLP
jgi:AcrR family transcriptional regulator